MSLSEALTKILKQQTVTAQQQTVTVEEAKPDAGRYGRKGAETVSAEITKTEYVPAQTVQETPPEVKPPTVEGVPCGKCGRTIGPKALFYNAVMPTGEEAKICLECEEQYFAKCSGCLKTLHIDTLIQNEHIPEIYCQGCFQRIETGKRQQEHTVDYSQDMVHQALEEEETLPLDFPEPPPPPPPKEMTARFPEPSLLTTIVNAAELCSEELWLTATPEGLTYKAMDRSHVYMLTISIPNANLEKYDINREFAFGVRLEDLKDRLKRMEKKTTVDFNLQDNTLTLRSRGKRNKEFDLPEVEGTPEEASVPSLQFNASITLDRKGFEDMLKDIEAASDHVKITATNQQIEFSGRSDAGKAKITLDKSSPDLLDYVLREETQAIYPISYLTQAVKAIPSDTVTLEYSNKMPIRLTFKIQETTFEFYLAPRIAEER